MSRGIIYVATGKKHAEVVLMSIASLRRFSDDPVTVLTDQPRAPLLRAQKVFDITVNVQRSEGWGGHEGLHSRCLKTQVGLFSPHETTLFLDADTLVLQPLDSLFEMATQETPIAMTNSQYYKTVGGLTKEPRYKSIPKWAADLAAAIKLAGASYPYFSSSTIVWRRTPKTLDFFRLWHEEWRRFPGPDMVALVRALYRADVKVRPLDRKFNLRNTIKRDTVIHTSHPGPKLNEVYKRFPALVAQVRALSR